jgi:hypothetical protein
MSTPTKPILPAQYTLAGAAYATHEASPARCLALFSAVQANNVDVPMAHVYAASLALTSNSSGVVWKPGNVLLWMEAVFDAYIKKGVRLNPEFMGQGAMAWGWVKEQIPFEKELQEAEDFSAAPQAG